MTHNPILSRENFRLLLETLGAGEKGAGVQHGDCSYILHQTETGLYHGNAYTKPACIRMADQKRRFLITLPEDPQDPGLCSMVDPTRGFDFSPITRPADQKALEALFQTLIQLRLNPIPRPRINIHQLQTLDPNTLFQLTALFMTGVEPEVLTRFQMALELAIQSPKGYLAHYQPVLMNRGVTQVEQLTPEIVLAQHLILIGKAVEVDWNVSPQDLVSEISRLAGFSVRHAAQTLTETQPWNLRRGLQKLADAYQSEGLLLVEVDLNADSFVITSCPTKAQEKLSSSLALLELNIHPFTRTWTN